MMISCGICLEVLSYEAEVSCGPCGHLYHHGCFTRWLLRDGTCPLCHALVSFRDLQRIYFSGSDGYDHEDIVEKLNNAFEHQRKLRHVVETVREHFREIRVNLNTLKDEVEEKLEDQLGEIQDITPVCLRNVLQHAAAAAASSPVRSRLRSPAVGVDAGATANDSEPLRRATDTTAGTTTAAGTPGARGRTSPAIHAACSSRNTAARAIGSAVARATGTAAARAIGSAAARATRTAAARATGSTAARATVSTAVRATGTAVARATGSTAARATGSAAGRGTRSTAARTGTRTLRSTEARPILSRRDGGSHDSVVIVD